jgi:hypothetical protein
MSSRQSRHINSSTAAAEGTGRPLPDYAACQCDDQLAEEEVSVARRVLALISLGLVLVVCVALAASESLTDRTGRSATAVTVTFSEQVRITSYDEAVFPTKEPSSRSETFRFSGGQLENGARFSVSWTPSTAEITNNEWETTSASASASSSSAPLTYEQIMAQIAHYPGPDEPLYVPAEGEQIWLTDLEGHADIYDNDSIKINYASGFDKSQITRIDVYRNGIKMRFLPALFDVLTNDQMKTFDGNPAENTPASSHTDHAIFGYEYSFRLFRAASAMVEKPLAVEVRSPVRFKAPYLFASLWGSWFNPLVDGWASESYVRDYLRVLQLLGIQGIQLDVELYTDGDSIFAVTKEDVQHHPALCHPQLYTVPDDILERMLGLIAAAGMQAEVRVQLDPTDALRAQGHWEGDIDPGAGARGEKWFSDYTSLVLHYVGIAEQGLAAYFCPLVEVDTVEQYTRQVTELYEAIDAGFSGKVVGSEATNNILNGWVKSGVTYGDFWAYDDIAIGMNFWPGRLEASADQRLSHVTASVRGFWEPAVDHYNSAFADHDLIFAEVGCKNLDGVLSFSDVSEWPSIARATRDDQEVADFWGATMLSAVSLGLDGVCIWAFEICWPDWYGGSANLYQNKAAQAVIRAFLAP